MSILVKGIDMPNDCKVCPFCDYEQGLCLANNYMDTAPRVIGKRHDDCPLIEVPTPHGRLIDADKQMNVCMELVTEILYPMDSIAEAEIVGMVGNAPTVIDKEES